MQVGIIGCGKVGMALAYALVVRGLVDRLALVGRDRRVVDGEVADLAHAEAFTEQPVSVEAKELGELRGCDLLVLTASTPWRDHFDSRFELGAPNRQLFETILPALVAGNPAACLLVVTNPVDVMTWHALRLSGWPPERVFGTGTLIDSGRFRSLLSEASGIHPDDLRAYILGEHGDSQFPLFSTAIAGGQAIVPDGPSLAIFERARTAGYEVMRRKGNTSYAIALAATLVIEALARDTRRTMPLSVRVPGIAGVDDVCLSLPVVVGRGGVQRIIAPAFNAEETAAFQRSAAVVRAGIEQSLAE